MGCLRMSSRPLASRLLWLGLQQLRLSLLLRRFLLRLIILVSGKSHHREGPADVVATLTTGTVTRPVVLFFFDLRESIFPLLLAVSATLTGATLLLATASADLNQSEAQTI